MKRYESLLKDMLLVMAKGYGIGLVLSFVILLLSSGGFSIEILLNMFLLDLIVGSLVSMFLMSSSGVQNGLLNAAMNAGKSMIGSIFAAGFGSGLGIVLFVIRLFVFGIIALAIFLFVAISFPITVVYILIMFILEKCGIEVSDSVADLLDKVVPIVAFVITAIVFVAIMKHIM